MAEGSALSVQLGDAPELHLCAGPVPVQKELDGPQRRVGFVELDCSQCALAFGDTPLEELECGARQTPEHNEGQVSLRQGKPWEGGSMM
jgi:hypothetical protein